MEKNKKRKATLLSTLIPVATAGITGIVLTATSCNKSSSSIEIIIDEETAQNVKFDQTLTEDGLEITIKAIDPSKEVSSIGSITVGNKTLVLNEDYSYNKDTHKIIIRKDVIDNNPGSVIIKPNLTKIVTGLELSYTYKDLKVGESFNICANLKYRNDAETVWWKAEGDGKVTIPKSSNVGDNITVEAVSPGKVTLIAECAGETATCEFNILKVSGITLSTTSIQLKVGKAFSITATLGYSNSDDDIYWDQTGTGSIALGTVPPTKSGESVLVTALIAGDVNLIAKCNGMEAVCKITILPQEVTGIELHTNPEFTGSINPGETFTIWGSIQKNDAENITWTQNGSGSVELDKTTTITDEKVTVKGVKPGNVTLTATCGGKSASYQFTVNAIHIKTFSISPTTLDLKVGGSSTLTKNITPAEATDKSVTWVSSKPWVATVDETGKVVAVERGNTTITAKTNDGGLVSTCDVSVTATVTITSECNHNIDLNHTEGYALTATDEFGKEITDVTYSVVNPDTAPITISGNKVYPRDNGNYGTARIQVSGTGISSTGEYEVEVASFDQFNKEELAKGNIKCKTDAVFTGTNVYLPKRYYNGTNFVTLANFYLLHGSGTVKKLYIPNNITSISYDSNVTPSASTCVQITEGFSIPTDHTKFTTDNNDALVVNLNTKNTVYYGCNKTTAFPTANTSINNGALMGVQFGNEGADINVSNISSISWYAFAFSNIANFKGNSTVTFIGGYAFKDCKNMKGVYIPKTCMQIAYACFNGCDGLLNANGVEIESNTELDQWEMQDENECSDLWIPSTDKIKNAKNFTYFTDYWYVRIGSLYDISTITGGVSIAQKTGGQYAGAYYGQKVYLGIPNLYYNEDDTTGTKVLEIAENGFESWSAFTTGTQVILTIHGNLTKINKNAFLNCAVLYKFNVDETVEKNWVQIGGYGIEITSANNVDYLKNCTAGTDNNWGYTGIMVANKIFEIYDGYIWLTDEALKEEGTITIPAEVNGQTVKGIYEYGFWNAKCQKVVFEANDNFVEIGYGAFSYVTTLTSITLPDSLQTIDSGAFYNCTGLTSITIPKAVTMIKYSAFEKSGLTSATFKTTTGWRQIDGGDITIGTDTENADHLTDVTKGEATGTNWGYTGIEKDVTIFKLKKWKGSSYTYLNESGERTAISFKAGVEYTLKVTVTDDTDNLASFCLWDEYWSSHDFTFEPDKSTGKVTKWVEYGGWCYANNSNYYLVKGDSAEIVFIADEDAELYISLNQSY